LDSLTPSTMRRPVRSFVILSFVIVLLALPTNTLAAVSLGQWMPTTNYPLQVAGASCFVYSGKVYCLGGFDAKDKDYNNAYYAPLSSSGIGAWTPTKPFPADIDSTSCVLWSATVYCVGGENSTSVVSNVYDAPVTSDGIGAWSQSAAYPQTIAATSCVVYSSYIYCIGGFDVTGDETASAYYSSLSSGLSSWTSTTPYPFAINSEACVVQGDYVYCVAGNEESGLPQFPVSDVYYAELSPSGIGAWTATTQYPEAYSTVSCILNSGDIYCAGGFNLNQLSSDQVYIAAITGSGVSSWTNATAYPLRFDVSSCVTDLSYVYCIAGRNFQGKLVTTLDSDYYAPLGPGNASGASTSTSSASISNSSSSTGVSSIGNSTSITSASTTTTAPEFNGGALVLTTLVALSVVALLFRTRVYRNGVRLES
jgi:N-acetylneuraminic acid mutarotase